MHLVFEPTSEGRAADVYWVLGSIPDVLVFLLHPTVYIKNRRVFLIMDLQRRAGCSDGDDMLF